MFYINPENPLEVSLSELAKIYPLPLSIEDIIKFNMNKINKINNINNMNNNNN